MPNSTPFPAAAALAWAGQVPTALCAVDAGGTIAWVNAAFEALTGHPADRAIGQAVAALLGDGIRIPPLRGVASATIRRADGTEQACDVQASEMEGGLGMLSLAVPATPATADSEIRRLADRLEFVQAHARIGLWEIDARTQARHWDAHMFRRFGLDGVDGVPSVEQIAQSNLQKEGVSQAVLGSMNAPGSHSYRARILSPEGTLRHMQLHWRVFAGQDGTPQRVLGMLQDDSETFALGASVESSGTQLQLASELAEVSIWRHDLATRRTHFNERAFVALGLSPRTQGLPVDELRDIIHPDDIAGFLASHEEVLHSHKPRDLQLRYRNAMAGSAWRHAFVRGITQRDGAGRPVAFAGVALDITEQTERTRRSEDLARHLDEVAEASGIGIWRIRRDDGQAIWNLQMYRLAGAAPKLPAPTFDEWISRCVHPDDRQRVRGFQARELFLPEGAPEIAHRIILPDGEVRHIVARRHDEPDTSPYRVSGVIIDVTDRENALVALREATERSALATRAAGIGIWEWDMDSGVSRWDDGMFLLRGLAARPDSPSIGEMAQWVHPDDRHFVLDQIQRGRVEDRPAYYEFRVVRPDGGIRWLASRSLALRGDNGRTRRRLGVNWDITEAREAAAARQERALVLRESQAKSELLSRMSHELRTPMNAVLGFTQLLLADEDAGTGEGHGATDAAQGQAQGQAQAQARAGVRRDRLEHIRAAGEHLLALIDDVLELSRLDGPERRLALQPVPLDALFAQAMPLVERLALRHGVTIVAEPGPLHVLADPARLRQVLVNLLSNAIKYNRPGGRVHLDVSPDAGRVLLRVADDGVGMTPAQQELAFEPFNRAGAEREGTGGTGIGLTIVKALVEGMGGRIEVSSEPGVGSVFRIWLDAAAASGPHALPTRRLLYVEDNEVNVMIVRELVRRHGDIEFHCVPDGASGVARAAQLLPGLMLVDMQLPDIDGLEVLARLRANPSTAGLRIVALSANAVPEDIRRALDAGFDDYWTKPLDFGVFHAAIGQVFGSVQRRQ